MSRTSSLSPGHRVWQFAVWYWGALSPPGRSCSVFVFGTSQCKLFNSTDLNYNEAVQPNLLRTTACGCRSIDWHLSFRQPRPERWLLHDFLLE